MGEGKARVEEMNYFELLAWLGIGSSHPGGFPATRQNLAALGLDGDTFVLDAGCGTGLTACFLAKKVGCRITGIDVNPEMIEKARLRAEKEGVSGLVRFEVADVYQLPFQANYFDLVMAESLTVFLNKDKVYREFFRVLKPGGKLADLEMALVKEMPSDIREQMERCFGLSVSPMSFENWVEDLKKAGFEYSGILNPQYLKPGSQQVVQDLRKDWVLVKDLAKKLGAQPGLLGRLQKNASFIRKNYSYFGYGLICGQKPVKTGFIRRLHQILNRSEGMVFGGAGGCK